MTAILRRTANGDTGTVIPPRAGAVDARFDGSFPPIDGPPGALKDLTAPVVLLAGGTR